MGGSWVEFFQIAALRVQLCAYFFDVADGGNPFAKGNTAAKAAADADSSVRSALALFAPSFVSCAHRHAKVLQAGLTTLLKLTGPPPLRPPSPFSPAHILRLVSDPSISGSLTHRH